MKYIVSVFMLVCISVFSFSVKADHTGIEGFNALIFRPNVDGNGILNVDMADTLYPGALYTGAHFQYTRHSLSFTDPALGGLATDLAENQVLGNFVLGVGLFEFLSVGIDIPVIFMQNGTKCLDATCTNLTNYTGYGVGDIRYVLKLRILDEQRYWLGLALASDVTIPTGNTKLFTGDDDPSYEQRLILSKKTKYIDVAANAGYRIVGRKQAIGTVYDDSVTFGAAIKGKLPYKLYAQATVTGNIYLDDRGDESTPVEFLAGVGRDWPKNISCHIGSGTKINDGIGAADLRVMGGCGIKFGLTEKAHKYLNAIDEDSVFKPQEWAIPFGTNKYYLSKLKREILDDVIRFINLDKNNKVMIIGNADDRGTYDYNMWLSTKRAESVKKYLFSHGIAPDQVIIETHGEAMPKEVGKTREARRANRSVMIREVKGEV